mmetsp:Transcript_2758/g.5330  ORF Transcript_2758/g.5330 Transcript_2758/m.5330 type:complete len:414 (+) Transcript_2758:237-1478(+)
MGKRTRKADKEDKQEKRPKAEEEETGEAEEGDDAVLDLVRLNKEVDSEIGSKIKTTGEDDENTEEAAAPAVDSRSTSIFVGNLAFQIDEAGVYEAFGECGEQGQDSILAIRFGMSPAGEFLRYCHIDFDTADAAAKALELDGEKVLGNVIRVATANGPGGNWTVPKEPADNPDFVDRCCVKNLAYDITEEVLSNAFEEQQVIVKNIRFVTDRETGQFYGTSFITFDTCEDAAWAVALSEAKMPILGRPVRVEYCPHRNDKKKAAAAGGAASAPAAAKTASEITETKEKTSEETVRKYDKRSDVVRQPSSRPEGGTKTAFFGNLAFEIQDDDLREFCKPAEILTIRWLEDKTTGEFKGAGFADFATPEDVDDVVKRKNGKKMLNRVCRVDFAPNVKKAKPKYKHKKPPSGKNKA